ncbi:uncharacterized protein LOC116297238 [Actinia tenebrosa]|uniref:Uncharacterized protein LOC116297238 n=1 Tax=Actinia tenebrosa TaxID=6105 RepID=A0A6P8I9G0_ACTTE|nr:uncharacterized protein LOC116297238 [Actinia tenebrosa]
MVNSDRVLAEDFSTLVLICCLIIVAVEGLSNTDSPGNCTTQNSRCCKLGLKAARHHAISPIYTCYYEALIAGLDHQTSVAFRLRASKGRLRQIKNIARATAFRRRLSFCYTGKHKKCFESCCLAKRKNNHSKLKNASHKPTSTTTRRTT